MLLRAAGQLKLELGMPVFGPLFIDNYEARLDLARGSWSTNVREGGGECIIDAPFEGLEICTADGDEVNFTKDDEGFVHFTTVPEVTYLLSGSELDEDDIPSVDFKKKVNDTKKTFRCAVIGSSRCY